MKKITTGLLALAKSIVLIPALGITALGEWADSLTKPKEVEDGFITEVREMS